MRREIEELEAAYDKQAEKASTAFRVMVITAAGCSVILAAIELLCLFLVEGKKTALTVSIVIASIIIVLLVLLLVVFFIARREMARIDRQIERTEAKERAIERAAEIARKDGLQ